MRSSWGILVSRFSSTLSPAPPLPTARGSSFEAACGSCRACRGHGRAFEVTHVGTAPTPAWKTLRVFHSRLDAVLRSPVRRPASTSSHRPHRQSYFLNGATIAPKVTFLNGLTGNPGWAPGPGVRQPCDGYHVAESPGRRKLSRWGKGPGRTRLWRHRGLGVEGRGLAPQTESSPSGRFDRPLS
jgi:hypothetical protein